MLLRMKLGSSLACCLSFLQTETRRGFLSSFSTLSTNLAEMRLMFKLSAKMRWTVPYDSYYLTTWWIVCLRSARIASRTFVMFSVVVLYDGRPERSSSSTDFVRPWSVCSIKKFCFGSWHLRRLPVAFGGFLQHFFKDRNKILCRFFAP